jgi:hypothetical protein
MKIKNDFSLKIAPEEAKNFGRKTGTRISTRPKDATILLSTNVFSNYCVLVLVFLSLLSCREKGSESKGILCNRLNLGPKFM